MKTENSKPNKTRSPAHQPLLLEVGCEEIPARFLCDAEKGLGERVLAGLHEARLLANVDASTLLAPEQDSAKGAARTYSTPRRLIVHVPAILTRQPDKIEEILGPPITVAIDAEGKFTRAAESFAQKNSAGLEELIRTQTPKGEYLALKKTTPGRSAREILAVVLPQAVLGLTFPKSMYWRAKSDPRFVRPIRWVLALLGEGKQVKVVDFEILGVKSGSFTFGHRALGSKPIKVKGLKYYLNKLSEAHVEVDSAERRERLLKEAGALVADTSLRLVPDDSLAGWIANSTEWPRAMRGDFDERFLHLPREILITVMRDHQKYFAVEQRGTGFQPVAENSQVGHTVASLAPHFIAGLNMDSDPKGLIRQGHERVLTARFRDAEFFWNADLRILLGDRAKVLDRVTYHASLGTYGDKVRRMQQIAEEAMVRATLTASEFTALQEAISLSKCDLTTQMVQEFTELQGVVGGLYAHAQGRPEAVSEAVGEHYRPQGFEGEPPATRIGAVLSFVDKFDAVIAGFSAGLEPKGSNDPFAMRRNASGLVKVLLGYKLTIDLKKLVEASYEKLQFKLKRSKEEAARLALAFIGDRLRYYLEEIRGFRYDTVRAVLAAGFDIPADAQVRAEAMESLRGSDDLEALSAAAKRIRNILTKSATAADWTPGEVAAEFLTELEEKNLAEVFMRVTGEADRLGAEREYRRALEAISTLRPAVDKFFDKVLVMAENLEVRQNRLRLLKKLDELFTGIAHFAEIADKV